VSEKSYTWIGNGLKFGRQFHPRL